MLPFHFMSMKDRQLLTPSTKVTGKNKASWW